MYLHHLYALQNMFLPLFMTFFKTLGLPFGKNQMEIAHSKKSFDTSYSGGQLKRDSNVSFCASITTECIKTNNIPLKSPTKFLPEMKEKF